MPLPQSRQLVTQGHIENVAMTLANTEYSYTLPVHTRIFSLRLRDPDNAFKVSFEAGTSGTEYVTVPGGAEIYQNSMYTVDHTPVTLYFQCTVAGQVAEIVYWT